MDPVTQNQFLDSVVRFVGTASVCAKRACDEVHVHRAMQKRASDLAPEVLELLVKTGAVRADQRDAAAIMLGSHAESLALLKSAVVRMAELTAELATTPKHATDLGRGVTPPHGGAGGYDSLNDNYLGRRTSEMKASDLALMKVLD